MMKMQALRTVLFVVTVIAFCFPMSAVAQDEAPGKLLFTDLYFPEYVDSLDQVAFFKYIEANNTSYSRLTLGDPKTGKETTLFPDIDFNRDKVQAFAFMPDGKHVALVDKILTFCDIWLHDVDNPYGEPVRLTELEQFDPGYSADQMYQLGMKPSDVLQVKQMDISPDGNKIAMTFGILGETAIWLYEIDRNRYRKMTASKYGYLPKWFPDSETLVFAASDSISGKFSEDLFLMDSKTNKVSTLVATQLSESWATPSPDGKYVAFLRLKDGLHWDPWVVRISDRKTVRIIDLPEGKSCGSVIWNGDGSKLYLVVAGYHGKLPSLYEVDFDPDAFE